jgi:hypothetical protein
MLEPDENAPVVPLAVASEVVDETELEAPLPPDPPVATLFFLHPPLATRPRVDAQTRTSAPSGTSERRGKDRVATTEA